MNRRELYELAKKNIDQLEYKSEYSAGADLPYEAGNLDRLRFAILQFYEVPFLKESIDDIRSRSLFKSVGDKLRFDHMDNSAIQNFVQKLRIGLQFFINHYESISGIVDENELAIRLPEIKTFGDLEKIANDFKKSVEMPIVDSKVEGEVLIRTAEPGSIWLMVGVGTVAAVKLIAGITWAAAVLRKKKAEARIFEEHAKTLELKNEELKVLIDAQKTQLERVLESEAEAIIAKHYSHNDPETIERLKLSITSIAELINKGAKILPSSNSDDLKRLFPEYENLDLIESAIKKLKEE